MGEEMSMPSEATTPRPDGYVEVKKLVPTVGRVVYFHTRGSNDGVYPSRPLAAIITRVYDDETVSVVAFREAGMNNEIKVTRGENPGQWDWMPFQKGIIR